MWQSLANFGEEAKSTFELAGYYSTEVEPGLRVISYNSNYGFFENFYTLVLEEEMPEYFDMMDYIESELEAARENGEKVNITQSQKCLLLHLIITSYYIAS